MIILNLHISFITCIHHIILIINDVAQLLSKWNIFILLNVMFSYYFREQSWNDLDEGFLKVQNSLLLTFLLCDISFASNLCKPLVLPTEGGAVFLRSIWTTSLPLFEHNNMYQLPVFSPSFSPWRVLSWNSVTRVLALSSSVGKYEILGTQARIQKGIAQESIPCGAVPVVSLQIRAAFARAPMK